MSQIDARRAINEPVYSDYTPVLAGDGLQGETFPSVSGLQVDEASFYEDAKGQLRPVYSDQNGAPNIMSGLRSQSSGAGASQMPKVLTPTSGGNQSAAAAPRPPPRLAQSGSQPSRRSSLPEQRGMDGGLDFADDPEMSPAQLMHAATGWAKGNGFNPEQLMEFGHLIQMVTATYIPRNQINGLRALDQGSFGQIYSGVYDGSMVAVKQCSSDGSQIKLKMRELLLELSVLVRIRHPNIVTFWGTAANFPSRDSPGEKPYIGMVFELCEKGSLYRALHQNGLGYKLDYKNKMRIALEVARGMSYIHAKGIIHRDLNSRNILLTGNCTAKVADFGCARKVKGHSLTTTTISGSPAYMAPEQLEGKDLTDKIDVWAYGILFWEIVCDQPPWASKGNSLDALKMAVSIQGERLPLPTADRFPSGSRAQYIKLMEATWNVTPNARPSMSSLARSVASLAGLEGAVGEFL